MFNRQAPTWTLRRDAREILRALGKAAARGNGVYAPKLPGYQPYRSKVMQMLREMGVPIMARKAGRSSIWFVISMFDASTQKALAEEWRRREFREHYAETCRTYIALKANPHAAAEANLLLQHALNIGIMLGLAVADIDADLQPTTMSPNVADVLAEFVPSESP
jgi:hypothetical protein